jgi:hypothetical protein
MIRHYVFDCKCGKPIALHAEKIWQRFEDQDIPATAPHPLVIACFHCKRLGIYSLDEDSHHRTQYRVVSLDPPIETECFGWLQCDEASCGFLAPLFAAGTLSMQAEERTNEIASWSWDELRCHGGRLIRTLLKP